MCFLLPSFTLPFAVDWGVVLPPTTFSRPPWSKGKFSLPLACVASLSNSHSFRCMTKYTFTLNIHIHVSQRTFQFLDWLGEIIFRHKISCMHILLLACFSFMPSKIFLWITAALKLGLCTTPSRSSRLVSIAMAPPPPAQQTYSVHHLHSHWYMQQLNTGTRHCSAGLLLPSPDAFSSHGWENGAGTTDLFPPSSLLMRSPQEKETLKGNGPETETPTCSNESKNLLLSLCMPGGRGWGQDVNFGSLLIFLHHLNSQHQAEKLLYSNWQPTLKETITFPDYIFKPLRVCRML